MKRRIVSGIIGIVVLGLAWTYREHIRDGAEGIWSSVSGWWDRNVNKDRDDTPRSRALDEVIDGPKADE